jgi:ketosteroid isomerase-like protein
MIRSLLAFVALTFAFAPPVTASPAMALDAKDIVAVINLFNDSMNRGEMSEAQATFTPAPSIIDEFPPHHWDGPTAFADWGAAFEANSKSHAISMPAVKLLKPSHVSVEGDRAYAVVPALYEYRLHGRKTREQGLFTFALAKIAGHWKIDAWSWTRR